MTIRSPKRVLVVGEYGALNGGENSLLAVAPAIQQFGWELHAACPINTEFSQALNSIGIPTYNLPMQYGDGSRKSQSEIRDEFADMIRQKKPDLIHCNSLSTSRLFGPVANRLNIPSLGYLRDILKLSRKAISDINELDRIVAVSGATKNWHCAQGLDGQKTHVVYNGVDTDLFHPNPPTEINSNSPIKSELQIPDSAPVLLYVGQIGMRKAVDVLVDAFMNVANQIPTAHLLIVGQRHSQKEESIEYENRIVAQIQKSKFSPQIHWLGRRTDVPTLMRTATLLIHPARQEPLGRVILEAIASGLPVVTTRVGGSPEILDGPEFAELLVEKDDATGMARAILNLLSDPVHRSTIGHKLRERAERHFSIRQCAAQLNQHYRELLGETQAFQ